MNRKRIILFLAGSQFLMLGFLLSLFLDGVIRMPVFLAILVTISLVYTVLVVMVARKFPN